MRISSSTIKALTGTLSGSIKDFFLKQGETRRVQLQFTHNSVPIDITDYVFESELRELTADSAGDTTNGYNISNPAFKANGNVISLTSNITITDALNGNVQFYIPPTVSSQEALLNPEIPVMYYGYLSINDGASVDPEIQKQALLVVVTNDGV